MGCCTFEDLDALLSRAMLVPAVRHEACLL